MKLEDYGEILSVSDHDKFRRFIIKNENTIYQIDSF